MHRLRLLPLVCCFALLAPAQGARAAWSTDPAANFPVADGSSDQAQTKLVPALDGGTWVSWFDGIGSGYDVRVQKVDADGNEVFAHNGILVANRSFSSTQDYGLDADASGNALLVFRDDRVGGTQITAALVTGAGTQPWGVTGVQLTATPDFVAAPKIAGTSDGGCVVAWTQNSSTRVQKLDAGGVPQWAPGITLTPATGSYSVSDLHGFGTDAVLAFVHQTGSFGSPRHILAQRFDASGALVWGASHVAVFDGGSLQFGNFPYFEPDGTGGGVFSWYDTAGATLQCYAQHILANGTEAFPHNGTAVSTNTVRVRVSPSASFLAGNTYVFWQELNSLQSQSGVYGQKLDATGARQWGAEGVVVVPVSSTGTTQVHAAAGGVPGGAFVFWDGAPSFGTDRLYGAGLDAAGAISVPTFDVCSVASSKLRLAVAPLNIASPTRGQGPAFVVLAWTDGRTDDGDVYMQNVNGDGSLGPSAYTAVPTVASGSRMPSLGAPRPNPSSEAVTFALALPEGRTGTIAVHDVRGRAVRQLALAGSPGGTWTWDGRDDAGNPVASGVYFVELRTGDGVTARRVTRIR